MNITCSGTASDIQYSATGGSDDWARGVAGIKWGNISKYQLIILLSVFQVGLSDRAARQGKGLPTTTKVIKKKWVYCFEILSI